MYCPRCGQHQITQDTKFCSRCGMPLDLVTEIISHGGFLPQLAELYKGRSGLFTRKNGIIFSILWFIVFVMMLPAFFGLGDFEEAAGASAIFGVFTTMIFVIASLAFLKKGLPGTVGLPAELSGPKTSALSGRSGAMELNAAVTEPAAEYASPVGSWKVPDTGDLVRPGSVTESTTRLLKKNADDQ